MAVFLVSASHGVPLIIDKPFFSTRMPAQSGDPISSALQYSLSSAKKCKGGEDLDSRILASAKQILLTEIKYEKTKCYDTSILSDLKSKYIVFNTIQTCDNSANEVTVVKESVVSEVTPKKIVVSTKEPICLPTPKRVLYSPDAVQLGWSGQVPVGSGFVNLGNTCYLNSSLQALFHVPAFVNWLLSDTNHSSKCESLNGVTHSECLICAMCKILQSSQKCTGSVVKPLPIYSKLKLICKHLVHGHQEDAHEFLRYLIEGMERSYLTIFNGIKLDSYSKETTPLNQIFGGYLRSEVTCLECQHVSTTFQHFQDLLLDIRTASSVDDALDSFFSRERLGDGDQAYRCEQCKRRVAATKKFTIERPPKALCIALKRFGAMGGKNSKTISLKQILDISKFRHRPSPTPLQYKLVSMITHLGPSTSCGHYTAVGITASGTYYLFDDNHVRPLPLHNVLNSNPYILMYEMDTIPKKLPQSPKKEVLSNGFSNSTSSNGHSNMRDETKASSITNNSSPSVNANSKSSTSSDLKIGQNGVNVQPKSCKVLYIKGRVECHPGPSVQKVNQDSHPPSQSPLKVNKISQETANQEALLGSSPSKIKLPSLQKEPLKQVEDKSVAISDNSFVKKTDLPSGIVFTSVTRSISRPSVSKENYLTSMPLPCPAEKKVEENISSNLENENSSPALRLVPYMDGSSESESEFVSPKPATPTKEPLKQVVKLTGRSSPTIIHNKAKGVRIEIEGWEYTANQPSTNRTDLHSPAGSTSSGKWSVTSTEREKTPEKLEKKPQLQSQPSPSVSQNESINRVSNGSDGNGNHERWDGSRSSSSTMDHLLNSSHRGYGSQVKSWNGGRSEMDLQVEGERKYLKRSHDSYNDEFDRGKAKKLKKYHKENNGAVRNRFQEFQNRKNSWQGVGQKYFRDYALENRNKPQRYYFNNNRNRFWE